MTNCKHISTCPFWAKFNDCIDECPCYANADIVEVVRCKDCKERLWCDDERVYWCAECKWKCNNENWYCAGGERRIENEQ